jgi:hypothetical protein
MAVQVVGSDKDGSITLGKPVALFAIDTDYKVSSDGQRFLLNAHPPSEPPAPIAVMLNWKAKP